MAKFATPSMVSHIIAFLKRHPDDLQDYASIDSRVIVQENRRVILRVDFYPDEEFVRSVFGDSGIRKSDVLRQIKELQDKVLNARFE